MDRQDRIVIMVGLVILIIAIAGIIYHEKTYVVSEEIKKNNYIVSYMDKSDEIIDEGFVGKDGWSGRYTIETEENAVIYGVDVIVEWSDNLDFHGIIFGWNWSDLIEACVEIPEMGFSQSASGYQKIEIKVEENKPQDKKVEAKSREEVEELLKGEELNKVNCSIDLSITTKPLFFDKGNDFRVKIIYHYCVPTIKAVS